MRGCWSPQAYSVSLPVSSKPRTANVMMRTCIDNTQSFAWRNAGASPGIEVARLKTDDRSILINKFPHGGGCDSIAHINVYAFAPWVVLNHLSIGVGYSFLPKIIFFVCPRVSTAIFYENERQSLACPLAYHFPYYFERFQLCCKVSFQLLPIVSWISVGFIMREPYNVILGKTIQIFCNSPKASVPILINPLTSGIDLVNM